MARWKSQPKKASVVIDRETASGWCNFPGTFANCSRVSSDSSSDSKRYFRRCRWPWEINLSCPWRMLVVYMLLLHHTERERETYFVPLFGIKSHVCSFSGNCWRSPVHNEIKSHGYQVVIKSHRLLATSPVWLILHQSAPKCSASPKNAMMVPLWMIPTADDRRSGRKSRVFQRFVVNPMP